MAPMRLDKQAIAEEIRKLDPELRRLHVRSLELFGSHVTGQADERSDLDFLVTFDESAHRREHGRALSLFDLARVHALLEDHFGREVDLVMRECVYPPLRPRVYGEAQRVA